MTERRHHFASGNPFTLDEIGNGQVLFRYTFKGTEHEFVITPDRAADYAKRSFTDPESVTRKEQMLLNAWCLGQSIIVRALAARDDGAGAAASTAPHGTGAPKDQPALVPAGAPVSSCRNAECG